MRRISVHVMIKNKNEHENENGNENENETRGDCNERVCDYSVAISKRLACVET